jgi:phage terminase small subunit
MSRPRKKQAMVRVASDTPLISVGTTASSPVPCTLGLLNLPLTALEEKFAQLFVLYCNATQAYVEATGFTGKRHNARAMAWEMSNKPHIRKRVREYESAAAAITVIDYAAILEHDREIVEGYRHADQVTQHLHVCCRYCHGVDHRYQWVDFEEYLGALTKTHEQNEYRLQIKQRELPMPSEAGGYGYDPQGEPNLFCPRCEGRGSQVAVICDTTKLTGPARAIVKGVKITNTGTEILFHDIDKAKERLLRAGRIIGDDAASVARGAAAGAAAGATAAIAAAQAAAARPDMTAEEAQRLYQELA